MKDKTKIKTNPRIETNFIGWDIKTKLKNQNIDGWGICTDSEEAIIECQKENIKYNTKNNFKQMTENEIESFDRQSNIKKESFII